MSAAPFRPSGVIQPVIVHHDCATPTVLRFAMLEPTSQLLNVREKDEIGPLASASTVSGTLDGGGLATQPVCGVELAP